MATRTLAAAALLLSALLAVLPAASAADPTSYLDIHLVTSFSTTGSLESGYLFRVPASESNFAGSPPKGPKWATNAALTGGAGGGDPGGYQSHRLMLPPDEDAYLCNEADGVADYQNPAGNAASGVFDADTLLSGFEGGYILVPRGGCTFEAKGRSAQRLGAAGVVVRNTLDSRYGLVDETVETNDHTDGQPDWANTRWPKEQRDYECGTHPAVSPSHPDTHRFGWRAEVEASAFDFSPSPYDGSTNNQLLTGTAVEGNLCAKRAQTSSFEKHCPTQRCLLTGRNATGGDKLELKLEACCAWDEYIRMSTDGDDDDMVPEEEEEKITIPALFVTMEKGEDLYDLIIDAEKNSGGGESVQFVNVVPYARWYPHVHGSTILLLVLAIFTMWLSSYESAKEYRTSWKKISTAVSDGTLVFQRSATNSNATGRERVETEDTVDENFEMELNPEVEMTEQTTSNGDEAPVSLRGGGGNSDGETPESPFTIEDDEDDGADFANSNEDEFVGNPPASSDTNGASNSVSAVLDRVNGDSAPVQSAEPEPQRVNLQSRSTAAPPRQMEVNAFRAVFFIVMAAAFIFVLFFFNLYKVVRVLYGLAGSVAMTEVIFKPLYARFASRVLGEEKATKLQSNAFSIRGMTFKWIDVLASASGWAFGIAWIVVGLTWVQPMNNAYYWIVQDVMGVTFCVVILGLIHINTIMIASIVLLLVWVYHIFYVLISPYFFGTSIVVDVAVGGAFRTDPTYCDKYPSDSACRGSLAPLPFILAIPWFNDFRGGFSMIGYIGDILLPGLLISFAARYDSAKALVRKCSQAGSIRSGENEESTRSHYHLGRIYKALFQGYYGPLMIAYAIGLVVAYMVVWATKKGHPALLYLVPACLGTVFFLGWRRRELSELWSGPKAMMKANRMVTVAGRIPPARAPATTSPANVAEAEVV